MKAKDLIKILSKNPESIVCFNDYIGYDTPLLPLKSVEEVDKDRLLTSQDKSPLLDNSKRAKKALIILRTFNES